MDLAGVGDRAGRPVNAGKASQVVVPQYEFLEAGHPPQVSEPLVGDLGVAKVEPPDAIAVLLEQALV